VAEREAASRYLLEDQPAGYRRRNPMRVLVG
jgi:hypothetical protein